LRKFCDLFVKLHFFSLKVTEFVGENTNFVGWRVYLSSLFCRWGLPVGAIRSVWPWRWRHYVSKYLPVWTAWRHTENVLGVARVLFVGHLFLIRVYLCIRHTASLLSCAAVIIYIIQGGRTIYMYVLMVPKQQRTESEANVYTPSEVFLSTIWIFVVRSPISHQ
jgi:hypothetical protein